MELKEALHQYLEAKQNHAVSNIDIENKTIEYHSSIQLSKEITSLNDEEEIVRAIALTKLVNDYNYPIENIELDKEYELGRPKVKLPKIDIIVRNNDGTAFLFIEVKLPQDFERNQDEVIENQLFSLADSEMINGNAVKYMVLMSCELNNPSFPNKLIVIDREKYPTFEAWKAERNYTDELPVHFGFTIKEPYIKGGKKDLDKNCSKSQVEEIANNFRNVLWEGVSAEDNEIFSSLVNVILAKIQDENEKKDGEIYDFQTFMKKENDTEFEELDVMFDRINKLYRRALKQRMHIINQKTIDESFVIDKKKFTLAKLKYAVSVFEKFSLTDKKKSVAHKSYWDDFFEEMLKNHFTQDKTQFFTHSNIVKFILFALQADQLAINSINNHHTLPYVIDPSAGSSNFLLEYMRFIVKNIKYLYSYKLSKDSEVAAQLERWFKPDGRENRWAQDYIYGIEKDFSLATISLVSMTLHGNECPNIFAGDGLLPFREYEKNEGENILEHNYFDDFYGKNANAKFDIVISNSPFSIDVNGESKKKYEQAFLFTSKKNTENLFIERYYQLLKERGRMAIVLPESVFDTTENKYIRLFLYKYFNIKAVVSLPTTTFAPYSQTKTSILFAQKKSREEVSQWDTLWETYIAEWSQLKTRAENLLKVYIAGKKRSSFPSIKELTEGEEKEVVFKLLKSQISDMDKHLEIKEILTKYQETIVAACKCDNTISNAFGFINSWWAFGKMTQEMNYEIFMAEADHVGYKRTKRVENMQPNDLYRVDGDGDVVLDDGKETAILDYIRNIKWD